MTQPGKIFIPIVCIIAFGIVLKLVAPYTGLFETLDRWQTERTEERIRSSLEIQKLNDACRDLPMLDRMTLQRKSITEKKQTTLFNYYHFAGDTRNLMAQDMGYLKEHDWEHLETKTDSFEWTDRYKKGDVEMLLTYGVGGDFETYVASCTKIKY